MKRFLRYLLLILLILIAGLWVWSHHRQIYFELESVDRSTEACVSWGSIDYYSMVRTRGVAGWHISQNKPVRLVSLETQYRIFQFMGLTYDAAQNETEIILPLWMPTLLLAILTAWFWYHPIKNWWRGTDRQGFPVEVTKEKNERQDAKSAKEGKE